MQKGYDFTIKEDYALLRRKKVDAIILLRPTAEISYPKRGINAQSRSTYVLSRHTVRLGHVRFSQARDSIAKSSIEHTHLLVRIMSSYNVNRQY